VDLNDLRQQIMELKKIGSVRDLMVKAHCLSQMSSDSGGIDADSEINRIQGIIDSMTRPERSYPVLITVPKRCLRIADGAGVKQSEVSRLYTRFEAMREMVFRFELGGWRKV
jgi:signal recognition particle subunit SRP54